MPISMTIGYWLDVLAKNRPDLTPGERYNFACDIVVFKEDYKRDRGVHPSPAIKQLFSMLRAVPVK